MSADVDLEQLAQSKNPDHRFVGETLLRAVNSGASAVHYEPWRHGCPLSYSVSGVRHEIWPPPHFSHQLFADIAQELSREAAKTQRTWRMCLAESLRTWANRLDPIPSQVEDANLFWKAGRDVGIARISVRPLVSPEDAWKGVVVEVETRAEHDKKLDELLKQWGVTL